MNPRIAEILREIRALEDELATEMQVQQEELYYWFEGKKIKFENSVRAAHARVRVSMVRWFAASNPRNVLSAPFIYAMIVPFAFLDLSVTLYQAICFRLYRIPTVARSHYVVVDRQHLHYFNVIEKLNCVFCGYANGVIAYVREVSARTEQYWCPVKHAQKILDPHSRYARFADFGDSENFRDTVKSLRADFAVEYSRVDAA